MENIEGSNVNIEKDDVCNENLTDESQDVSSHHDETDSYHPPESVKSEGTPDEMDEEEEMEEANRDDEDDSLDELDDMEGTVIHFLAEKSIRKTKVKSGIKSACRFKCDNCTSIFRYKSTLNYHLKSECGRKVIKGKALVEKQPQGKVSCNICAKTLCSRTSLMVHMRIHTGERPFVCPECDRSFFQKAHLVDHQAKMHTASCVLCRLCNSTFEDKYHLLLHMKEHKQAVSPFNCKLCDESFSTRASLSNHMAGRHSTEVKTRTLAPGQPRTRQSIDPNETMCFECGRSYSGPRQLRAHVRRAHRASLPCPHCPRLFPSGYDLRVHSRCHTGERPYSCEFCERTFSRKSILDVHRTLHTGQKDFVCSICSKAFNRKSKLQVHFTEHTRQTVKCDVCQKEFKCQSYLSSHMKIHSEEQIQKQQQKRKRAVPALKPIKSLKIAPRQSPRLLKNDSKNYSEESTVDDESTTADDKTDIKVKPTDLIIKTEPDDEILETDINQSETSKEVIIPDNIPTIKTNPSDDELSDSDQSDNKDDDVIIKEELIVDDRLLIPDVQLSVIEHQSDAIFPPQTLPTMTDSQDDVPLDCSLKAH